jgi:prepilin-type N-terminal cleavage/methylation domain-containing protein
MTKRRGDQGMTLIELLLVIVVLAVLAMVVVASVRGVKTEAERTSCEADAHVLYTAGEAYFAQLTATSIPAVGSSADRFELALVNAGFLHEPSKYYDLDANGDLSRASGSPCNP